jgi:HlyD family secretion protein
VKPNRKSLILGAALVLAVAGMGSFALLNGREQPQFSTVPAARGNIQATVSATGTLNAVITVQVGTQVSGTIQQLFVDYNSPVKKGQLIARIDPATFDAKVNQAKADVASAQATVLNQQAAVAKAEADLATAKANVIRQQVAVQDAKTKWESRVQLFQEGGISAEERDTAQATHDSAIADLEAGQANVRAAQASLDVARAQVSSAEAQVRLKQAALAQAQVDLDNTSIRAPVDGVVVARNVDVGQTVAASLQAPTLFLIAQDLTKMQVDTNVDEADVGRVTVGQAGTFTVDAYPGQQFQGKIVQVRQAPQVVQNVVTYDVVLAVANPELKLMPGMTANAKILVARRDQVLLVPNMAFRVRVDSGVSAGPQRMATVQPASAGQTGMGSASRNAGAGAGASVDSNRQRVWVLQDGKPVARGVQTGLSDGEKTEVVAGLKDGEAVITSSSAGAAQGSAGGQGGPRLRL